MYGGEKILAFREGAAEGGCRPSVPPSEARRWRGFLRAYDLGQSHHALRAWHIVSDFGNRCELGKINTPTSTPAASCWG